MQLQNLLGNSPRIGRWPELAMQCNAKTPAGWKHLTISGTNSYWYLHYVLSYIALQT